jgi:hypothetical protein
MSLVLPKGVPQHGPLIRNLLLAGISLVAVTALVMAGAPAWADPSREDYCTLNGADVDLASIEGTDGPDNLRCSSIPEGPPIYLHGGDDRVTIPASAQAETSNVTGHGTPLDTRIPMT